MFSLIYRLMFSLIYKFFCFLGVHLPLPLSYFIAGILARIKYVFSPSLRKQVRENIRITLSWRKEKKGIEYSYNDVVKITKKAFLNFARYLTDFFNIPEWDRRRVDKKVVLEKFNILDNALSKGKGVIALTAHIGNWELAGIVASILGYKISAIAIPYFSPSITKIYVERRRGKGVDVILTGSNPKYIIKALKENRILAILGDRVFTEKGMKVEFMGREVLFPRGPATLAIKTGAEFIAGFLIMEKNGYRMFFREIETPPFHLSEEEKIKFLTQKGATLIEEVILSYPSQWLNFSNVWEKSITRITIPAHFKQSKSF